MFASLVVKWFAYSQFARIECFIILLNSISSNGCWYFHCTEQLCFEGEQHNILIIFILFTIFCNYHDVAICFLPCLSFESCRFSCIMISVNLLINIFCSIFCVRMFSYRPLWFPDFGSWLPESKGIVSFLSELYIQPSLQIQIYCFLLINQTIGYHECI